MDWLTTIGLILSGLGLLGTAYGLHQASKQIEQSRRVALGEFLLNLDTQFRQHQTVHTALRPGGKWASGNSGPTNGEEWSKVEAYMGLFERINILVEKEILDAETVKRLYSYRVANIVANPIIRKAKLVDNARYWTDFSNLCQKLSITY